MSLAERGFRMKRVYENPAPEDGFRILVDRLWPRGVSKEKAAVDLWLKEIAPSDGLRKWFSHDPRKWTEFMKRYHRELAAKEDLITVVENKVRDGNVTLLYGAADREHNNAAALQAYLEKSPYPRTRAGRPGRAPRDRA